MMVWILKCKGCKKLLGETRGGKLVKHVVEVDGYCCFEPTDMEKEKRERFKKLEISHKVS